MTPADALRDLLNVLDEKIDGLPEHPWIPGAAFKDGRIERAIEVGRSALVERQERAIAAKNTPGDGLLYRKPV